MSWKPCVTFAFATILVAGILGCDDDSVSPDTDPISIGGLYEYLFDVSSADDEIVCGGEGFITFTQESDTTFTAVTEPDGTVLCEIFGQPIESSSGTVAVTGRIDRRHVTLEFPLAEASEVCTGSADVLVDEPLAMTGTLTCVLDLAAFGFEDGGEVTVTGPWSAERTSE